MVATIAPPTRRAPRPGPSARGVSAPGSPLLARRLRAWLFAFGLVDRDLEGARKPSKPRAMSEQGDDSSDRPARGASPLVTAFNIFNCAVGAGILSLPYAFSQTGAILGVFVACAVVGLVVFTLNVLLRFGDAHDAWSYQALVQKALGRRFSLLVSLTLILYIFGSCVAYTIIIADSVGVVAQFARNAARASSSAASPDAASAAAAEANAAATVRACAIVLASALVLTPLSMLRKTRSLGPTSSLTVAALLYTTSAVVGEGVAKLRAGPDGAPDGAPGSSGGSASWWSSVDFKRGTARSFSGETLDLWRFDEGTVLALPVFVFAFQCHIQILSFYAEFRDEPRDEVGGEARSPPERLVVASDALDLAPEEEDVEGFPGFSREAEASSDARRRAAMERTVLLSMLTLLVGYATVGEFAYATNPDVASNMLQSYPATDPWMLAASASMGVSAIGSYPINHHSSRAALDDVLCAWFGWVPAAPGMAPAKRHATQTLVFVLLTTITSLLVEDLGVVFQLVGSTAGVLVICFVPGALLLASGASKTTAARAAGGSRLGGVLDGSDESAETLSEDAIGPLVGASPSRPSRRAGRHWTEGGGSIGGYDELGAAAAAADELRAALLPAEEEEEAEAADGGPSSSARRARSVSAARRADAARGAGLVLLGVVIAVSNVYVLFFARAGDDDAGAR